MKGRMTTLSVARFSSPRSSPMSKLFQVASLPARDMLSYNCCIAMRRRKFDIYRCFVLQLSRDWNGATLLLLEWLEVIVKRERFWSLYLFNEWKIIKKTERGEWKKSTHWRKKMCRPKQSLHIWFLGDCELMTKDGEIVWKWAQILCPIYFAGKFLIRWYSVDK